AALRHRDKTGLGQQIDVSLVDTQVSWLVNEGTNYLLSGQEPKRRGNQHPNIVPYQVFQASDGHVIVAAGNDGQYQRLCKLIGLPELADDPRFATNSMRLENRETLIGLLSDKIATLQKQELVDGMEANNVPGGAINTIPEVFESEQVQARDMKISMPQPLAKSGSVDLIGNPVKFSRTPVTYRHPPPQCGQQTDELLREILGDEVEQGTDSA
ncbi:MAG: CoA transferase, partial [Rhizobiales bacterium]|nr:CoA transferase [Hyphomicrobiales bacterium]